MPTYCLLLLAVFIVTGSAYEEERYRSNYKQPLNVKYASSNYQNTNLGPVLFPSESNENGSPKSNSASEDLSTVLSSANGTQTSEVEYHMRVEDSSAVVTDSTAYADREPPVLVAPLLKLLKILKLPTKLTRQTI